MNYIISITSVIILIISNQYLLNRRDQRQQLRDEYDYLHQERRQAWQTLIALYRNWSILQIIKDNPVQATISLDGRTYPSPALIDLEPNQTIDIRMNQLRNEATIKQLENMKHDHLLVSARIRFFHQAYLYPLFEIRSTTKSIEVDYYERQLLAKSNADDAGLCHYMEVIINLGVTTVARLDLHIEAHKRVQGRRLRALWPIFKTTKELASITNELINDDRINEASNILIEQLDKIANYTLRPQTEIMG